MISFFSYKAAFEQCIVKTKNDINKPKLNKRNSQVLILISFNNNIKQNYTNPTNITVYVPVMFISPGLACYWHRQTHVAARWTLRCGTRPGLIIW